jgi:hypothetical protein
VRPRATGARSRGPPGLKGWHGGAAKHGGGVRSMGRRGGAGTGLGRWSLAVRERSSTVTGGR